MFCFREERMAGELGVVEKKEEKENVGAGGRCAESRTRNMALFCAWCSLCMTPKSPTVV